LIHSVTYLDSTGNGHGARTILKVCGLRFSEAEGVTIGAWEVGADLRRKVAETIAARADEIASILV
jgi:hypothetical protein